MTPWVRTVQVVPVVLIAIVLFGQGALSGLGVSPVLVTVGILIVIAVLVAGVQFLAWDRLTYWIDAEGDFRIDSGILTRQQRRLQLSRLQSVDVTQPLLARVFGMAALTVEAAGAGDSRASLSYLPLADAQALRNEVIARSAGMKADVGEAPEEPLVVVPPRDLIISLLLRGTTVVLFAVTVLIVVTTVFTAGTAGLLVLLTGGIPLLIVFGEFTTYFNFTVARSADGLRLRSGLFQIKSQTIPPGRVQAVEFVQSWLWRRKDWVRVRLNVAGQPSADDGDGSSESVLLPVAPYDVALDVVKHVLPGVDLRAISLSPAPARARKRAWIQFGRLGVGHDDRVFVTERGRFVSYLAVVPHARTQSVRVTQGPWERALDLATMHVDSPPGPVLISALYRDAGEARAIAEAQNQRAQAALLSDPSTHWMRPENPPAPPTEEPPTH
ncbi:MAG: PH domain-containing protein [Actinomycetia bacterium]|nr:PH domain-containing protein [Actinomycetes bacterium]